MRGRWFQLRARLDHHRRLVLALSVVVLLVSGWRTVMTYAHLKSDLEALLPRSAPSVTALAAARERLSGVRHLGVVVLAETTEGVPAARQVADEIAQRVRLLPPELVSAVYRDSEREHDFIATHALAMMAPEDVRVLREAIEARRDWEVSKELDLLIDDSEAAPDIPWKKLEAKYRRLYGLDGEGPRRTAFESEDGTTQVVVVRVSSQATSYESDKRLLDAVDGEVAALGFRERQRGALRVGYAGDVAARVGEMEGLIADLGLSSVLVAVLVAALVIGYFRSWRALVVLGYPLLLGTTLTFAVAALPPFSITELNSNTAFLGAVVVGNGINAAVILLARYLEERRRGVVQALAIPRAVSATWRPTLAAAAAAAVAYGSLIVTQFRGFNQFGWIGGVGMLLCWATHYAMIPRLIPLLDPAAHATQRRVTRGASRWQRAYAALLARPGWIMAVFAVLTVGSVLSMVQRRGDAIEYDLSQLRRRDSWESGERFFGKKMDVALGRYLTPSVVLARTPENAATIARRVRELQRKEAAGGLIGSVRTARDIIRPDQGAALEEARRLAKVLSPQLLAKLEPTQREAAAKATSAQALVPFAWEDIPPLLTTGLREQDGQVERSVLIYPKLSGNTWDVERIGAFTDDVRRAAHVDGYDAPLLSALALSSDISEVMRTDAPRATGVSIVAVLVICWFAFRSLRLSAVAMASLVVGVALMLGFAAVTGEKLNFSNFVALPITFGIAADYSVNMLRRWQSETGAASAGLEASGGAVALCSATTIIGFGSLLVAQQQALFSFGVLAVAGEVACLVTALLLAPVLANRLCRRTPSPRKEQAPDAR